MTRSTNESGICSLEPRGRASGGRGVAEHPDDSRIPTPGDARVVSPGPSCRRRNLAALLVAAGALGVLAIEFEPAPAGADAAVPNVTASARIAPAPPLPSSSAEAQQVTAASIDDSRRALLLQLLLVEKGYARLERTPSYVATFTKRERVGETLADREVMQMKVRHDPFSVYMKWLEGDKGRELLYVAGQNDGNLIVHPGGWKARLLPALKLDPEGAMAMKEARYPVTMVGLKELARQVIDYRRDDLEKRHSVRCRMLEDRTFDDRPCYTFLVEYDDPQESRKYRKCLVYVDQKNYLPVVVKNYGWPTEIDAETDPSRLDEETLVEYYAYSDLHTAPRLADADFDHANESYKFKR